MYLRLSALTCVFLCSVGRVYVYTISSANVVTFQSVSYDSNADANTATMHLGFSVSATYLSSNNNLLLYVGAPNGNEAYGALYVFVCASPTATSCTKNYFSKPFESSNFVGWAVASLPSTDFGVVAGPGWDYSSDGLGAMFFYGPSSGDFSNANEFEGSATAVDVAVVSGTNAPVIFFSLYPYSEVFVFYCQSTTSCPVSSHGSYDYEQIVSPSNSFGFSIAAVVYSGTIYVAVGNPSTIGACTYTN